MINLLMNTMIQLFKTKITNNFIVSANKKNNNLNWLRRSFMKLVQIVEYKFLLIVQRNFNNIYRNWEKKNFIAQKKNNINNS